MSPRVYLGSQPKSEGGDLRASLQREAALQMLPRQGADSSGKYASSGKKLRFRSEEELLDYFAEKVLAPLDRREEYYAEPSTPARGAGEARSFRLGADRKASLLRKLLSSEASEAEPYHQVLERKLAQGRRKP